MTDKFHTELKNLKAETLEMAHLGRYMLRTAVDALIRQDNELAASVIARKEKIHEMEVRIEEHCYHLIALNQPMAKDMRTIACTLKVITASLRIGRYGKVIANIVEKISEFQSELNNMILEKNFEVFSMDKWGDYRRKKILPVLNELHTELKGTVFDGVKSFRLHIS